MSIQSEMRILPVVIQKYQFLNHEEKIFGRGKVKVKILKPIKMFKDESLDEFVQRTYSLMNSEYQLLNQM